MSRASFVTGVVVLLGIVALRYVWLHGLPPYNSQLVTTCDRAIRQRLSEPATYQRIAVEISRQDVSHAEFFTDPARAVPEWVQKKMIEVARKPPVRFDALIDYRAQDPVGAVIQARSTCTFYSLEGDDAPSRPEWVNIDGERNLPWVLRQKDNEGLRRRLLMDLE